MTTPICELCGGNDFVKVEGVFVCQGCGAKYSVEEARRLMIGAGTPQAEQVAPPPQPPQGAWQGANLQSGADFNAQTVNVGQAGARSVNNYICQAWQIIYNEYESVEHPSKGEYDVMVGRAKECLALLNSAAMLEPNNAVQCMLIYGNCMQIERAVKDAKYWEKGEDGSWKSSSMGFFSDVELPGQDESWEAKHGRYHEVLEQVFMDGRPDLQARKQQLEGEAAKVRAQLEELKSEKRSHGLFDFKGRGEVKDRMKPVKHQLSELESQISGIENAASDYADKQVEGLSGAYTRLDF